MSRLRRGVALLLGVALLATGMSGCALFGSSTFASASVKAKTHHTTTVETKDGVAVSLPAGAVPAGSRVRLTTRKLSGKAPVKGMKVLSHEAHVSIRGKLRKEATVRFSVPRTTPRNRRLVVVWQNGHGGWQWVPTTRSRDGKTAVGTVTHFSWGFLAWIDIPALGRRIQKDLTGFLVGRAYVKQPSCEAEKSARAAGVSVTSSDGDSVKWCYGIEDGKRVLKIANNRRTFTEVDFPKGWRVLDGGSLSFSLETADRAVGEAFTDKGVGARIVDGGDTLTLQVPDGASGAVHASLSTMAWLFSGIFAGVSTVALESKLLGAATVKAAGLDHNTIAKLLIGAGDDEVTDALRDCTSGVSDLTEAEPSAKVFISVAKFAWTCGVSIATTYLKEESGRIVAVALGVFNSALESVVGLGTFFTSIGREIWDEAASLGGHSDPDYDIVIRSNNQPTGSTPTPTPAPTQAPTTQAPTAQSQGLVTGAHFDASCVVAWPTAPVTTSTSIQMTMTCGGVPESEYLFTVVTYDDPNLDMTPDTGTVRVVGAIVGTAQSAYGYKELLVQASNVILPSGN